MSDSAVSASGMQPYVSVIIPVYNVKDYLAYCLESVMNQTLPLIEIVCVDDGSSDGSSELLARAAVKDARVKIVTKPNGGLSSARNAGIDAASGKYLCFLDADDSMMPEACEIIAATFEATDADVVTYGAEVYPAFRSYYWVNTVLSPRDKVYDGFDIDLLMKENSHPFAWRTACNREFLLESGVRFDESLPFGEDQVFHFELYPRASKTVLIADKLVSYRVSREGSLMFQRSADPTQRISEHIAIVSAILDDWDRNGFLASNEQSLFDWIIEFLAIDILSAQPTDRFRLDRELRSAIEPHFSYEFIDDQMDHHVHGFMARALFGDDPSISAGSPRGIRLRYFGARDGVFATALRSARVVRNIARERLSALTRKYGAKDHRGEEERAWELSDSAMRAAATQRLGD